MADVITLVLPPGGYDFPPAHGTMGFLPYRLQLTPLAQPHALGDQGGPWAIDVPADRLDIVGWFLNGVSGCYIYEGTSTGASVETAQGKEAGTGGAPKTTS